MSLSGNPIDFIFAFLGGILASFTPCVYPLIPISVSFIVGHAENSRRKGFFLSLAYVTGIAGTYSALGVLAVLTGNVFGRFGSHPVVNLISGILILVFGLFMFDLLHLNFVSNLKLPSVKKKNYLSALALGLVSGFMISPCLTPILASILAYVSNTKNVFYGTFLLFCFSYGMGLIFILIGTFGPALTGLPKPGKWMVLIKRVFALVLVVSGLYFIFTAIRRF